MRSTIPSAASAAVAAATAATEWPVRSASASALAERTVRGGSATTAPRTWRALPSNADCRRPDDLPWRPAPRNRQSEAQRAAVASRRRPAEETPDVHQRLVPRRPAPTGSSHCLRVAREVPRRRPRPARPLGSLARRPAGRCRPAPRRRPRSRSTPRPRRCTDRRRGAGSTSPRLSAPAPRARGRWRVRPRAARRRAGCSRARPRPGGRRRATPPASAPTSGKRATNASKMGSTRDACVCWSITSETRVR